jgi:hypothetical protein
VPPKGLGNLKNFIHLIEFRTHDLLACCIVPYPIEIKIKESKKIVLFLFRWISTYLSTFVASFEKAPKTLSRGFERSRVYFGRHVYLNDCSSLKPFLWGRFSHEERERTCWCRIWRVGDWLSPQPCVRSEILPLPLRIGNGQCHATGTNCPLLEIVPFPGNALKHSYHKLKIDQHCWMPVLHAQILYESHTVCQEMIWSRTFA